MVGSELTAAINFQSQKENFLPLKIERLCLKTEHLCLKIDFQPVKKF